ncbi:MAG TPA: 30S ribosomal protein S8 [Opitutaceae bacterium]|nr:30S ribosomal protein S8 [Opitutaceae bacterium]
MTDPISDFLTRVRNASKAAREECVAPYSKIKEALATILKAEGYIADFAPGVDADGHKTLVVKLKYVDSAPAITGLRRLSTPGRRLYCRAGEIPLVLNGLGVAILSTSKGLMKDQDCRRNKLGGELVCSVW